MFESRRIDMQDNQLSPKSGLQHSDFIVQPADPVDIAEIASLDKKMWGDWANSPALYRQLMDLFPETIFVVRTSTGEYAGCAVGLVRSKPSLGWVLSVDVDERFRWQGLGKLLIRHILTACRQLGVNEVVAIIDPANYASQKLFKSLGFEQKEVLDQYFGPEKDQQRWVLSFSPSTGL